jgi:hypothetical protein
LMDLLVGPNPSNFFVLISLMSLHLVAILNLHTNLVFGLHCHCSDWLTAVGPVTCILEPLSK